MKKTFFSLLFVSAFYLASAQEVKEFSLKEAQKYGLEHNYDMKNSDTDILIAKKKVSETLAIGLPQVNAKISTTNYLDVPTTLLPDFITPSIYAVNENNFGLDPEVPLPETEFFPAKFGTEFNAAGEISLTQLIFSGEYLVGLNASKTFLDQSKLAAVKTEIDVKETIARAYYMALVSEKNYDILHNNLQSLEKTAFETHELYKAGFVEETDADQLDLLVSDLQTNLKSLQNGIKISYLNLKYVMGLQLKDSLRLTDNLEQLLGEVDYLKLLQNDFLIGNNIDYRILQKQKQLATNNLRLQQSAYLPNISGFFSASTQAMRSKFDFFDSKGLWYPTTLWGIEMNIPIFSSGSRSSKVQQAKLELQKMEQIDSQLRNGLNINVEAARHELYNSYMVHQHKQKNLVLAEKIFSRNQEKYNEGVTSSMELQQTYTQFLTIQTEYINSILSLLNSKLTLEKLLEKVN
jgi:outer membrane protein